MPADTNPDAVKGGYLRAQVSEAIRLRLADVGISRTELARRMNRSRAAVTQMLAGTPNFEIATLENISTALNVQWLLVPTTTDYRKLRWEISQLVGHIEDGGEMCAPDCLGCNDPIAALIRDLREARQQRKVTMYQCDGCGQMKPSDEIESKFAYGCEGDFCHECRHGKHCDCQGEVASHD